MSLHAALDKTDAAHLLTRSVKLAAVDILGRCDDKCFDGLHSEYLVPGWGLPLRKYVQRAVAPDEPSIFDPTNNSDVSSDR